MIQFDTGSLEPGQIAAILNALPGDLTFVGKDDSILYFNQPASRLFGRDKAIIGTSVQSCHPPKSIPVVNRILEALKSGARDLEESWVDLGGRKVRVQYFAVRSASGEYLGCIEFAQDLSDLKAA
jgi:PAS domain S-box-containing protein